MLGLGKWRRRRRRSAEDAALLDAEERQANDTYRRDTEVLINQPTRRPGDSWTRAEESEFKPPKY